MNVKKKKLNLNNFHLYSGTNFGSKQASNIYMGLFVVVFAGAGVFTLMNSLAAPGNNTTEQALSANGDLNNDNVIDTKDISILLEDYGKNWNQAANPNSDLNGDNIVNDDDLSILLSKYRTQTKN